MHCSPWSRMGKCLLQWQIVSSMLNLLRCMGCSRELFNCTWSVCLCTKNKIQNFVYQKLPEDHHFFVCPELLPWQCWQLYLQEGKGFSIPAFFFLSQWVYCLGRGMFYQHTVKSSADYSLLAAECVVCISSFPSASLALPSPCPGWWWPPVGNGKIETPSERFKLQPWEKLGLV